MDQYRKIAGLFLAGGVLGTIAVLAVIGLLILYSGAYNVAATEDHASFTRWAFVTTMHNSVALRADDVTAPDAITPDMIEAGAKGYKATCQHCHAGPGVKRSEWASGMRPRPPHLTEAAADWELKEVFWIAKHGVKMTGMPAFGPSHDDQTLWSIAAFVKELPAMTSQRYAAFGGEHPHGAGQDSESGSGNGR